MHVTLDHEQWEAEVGSTLGEVFADLSARAQARSRIVTSLQLDQRKITDRDLDIGFLGESAAKFSRVTAISQSMEDIVYSAQQSAQRYAQILRAEGMTLLGTFRSGQSRIDSLDQWLGKLADYMELIEGGRGQAHGGEPARPLSSWVQDLLDARARRDTVLIADILEYEVMPRLEA